MSIHLLDGLAEALSPTRCAGCELPGTLLCPACAAALPRVASSRACPRCGAPADASPDGGCRECAGRGLAFAGAACLGTLEPPLSRMVVLFKDGGERRLGPLLGALALEALPRAWPLDAVTWVPAARAAVRRRGFDHAEAIAREVARVRGVPCRRMLERAGAAAGDQRALGRDARAANVGAAFTTAAPGAGAALAAPPAHVLLVDDVVTTGATCDACARALLAAGVGEVRVLAVARACGGHG